MNILLFGPPGAGKGTQSSTLVEQLQMHHISTGDLFRNAIKNQTALGKEAQGYMDKGELVPDSTVIGMVEETLKEISGSGFILDGFPRTVVQAEALEEMLEERGINLDKAIFLHVPEELLVSRLSGRRVCKGCGAVYHIESHPSKTEGVCDACGSEVVQREDDKGEVIQRRLQAYEESTSPLKEYYTRLGKFVEVDGVGAAEEVFNRLKTTIH